MEQLDEKQACGAIKSGTWGPFFPACVQKNGHAGPHYAPSRRIMRFTRPDGSKTDYVTPDYVWS